MTKRLQFILLFVFFYIFRVLFGLSHQFYASTEIERDSLQTYLIGLKYYTTGLWPYFGPDQYLLNTGYYSQIPGALEGMVIGIPFHILPIPEAPFLFLNLLSLLAISLLALYIVRRIRSLSLFFVFAWIALLPWTLNFSTHVFNPSFLLFGSVLFFVGFIETLPGVTLGWIMPRLALMMMGFGMGWDMQFHLSWVLLPPLVFFALIWKNKNNGAALVKDSLWVLCGMAGPVLFLLPTFLVYGFAQGPAGITHASDWFNFKNFKDFFTILARFLSLACFEIPRFIGSGTGERKQFFKDTPWLILPGVFLILLGWIQPFVLLFAGWFKDFRHAESRMIGLLTLAGFLWIWICFWFTSNGPSAHMYYLFFPLITIYFFYIWNQFAVLPWWKYFAWVCLVMSLWFQTGFMIHQFQKGNTIYEDRAKIVQAIDQKDYRILSARRPWPVFY